MKIIVVLFLFMVNIFQAKAQSCSVLCLSDQWMVKDYQKGEVISVSRKSTGPITARETGDVSLRSFIQNKHLKYKIAIRRAYDTIEMFSDQTYTTYPIEDIIRDCQPGEAIVIILTGNAGKYALPHHTIEISD